MVVVVLVVVVVAVVGDYLIIELRIRVAIAYLQGSFAKTQLCNIVQCTPNLSRHARTNVCVCAGTQAGAHSFT